MFNISLELIDYQVNDKVVDQLDLVFKDIITDIRNRTYKSNRELFTKGKYGTRIEKVIKDRFNLTVEVDPIFSDFYPAAIIPFSSDRLNKGYHVTIPGMLKMANGDKTLYKDIVNRDKDIVKERELLKKKFHKQKGHIDLKRGRMSGYLAESKHYLMMNFFALDGLGLTSREMVAVCLHEIGHAFTGMEYHHKFVKMNSSILDIQDAINQNDSKLVYQTFLREFGPEELKAAALSEDSEVTDFYGPTVAKYLKELPSQFYNAKYDETNFENLADSFATRFGLGDELGTSLTKMMKQYGQILNSNKVLVGFVLTLDVLLTVLTLVGIGAILGTFALLVYGSILLLFGGNLDRPMTYDFPMDRIDRIRKEVIGNLKDTNLPKEYTVKLLEQVVLLEQLLKDNVTYKTVTSMAVDLIKPGSREASYYIKIQQDMENALNNRLFVSSAKLKTI